MENFVTLKDAWEAFYAQSGLPEITGDSPLQVEAARQLFIAGCQGALYALSNIKEKSGSDPVAAIPMIHALYEELDQEVQRLHKLAREQDVAKNMAEHWPFPTGGIQ